MKRYPLGQYCEMPVRSKALKMWLAVQLYQKAHALAMIFTTNPVVQINILPE